MFEVNIISSNPYNGKNLDTFFFLWKIILNNLLCKYVNEINS